MKFEMINRLLSVHLSPVPCLAWTKGVDPPFFWAERAILQQAFAWAPQDKTGCTYTWIQTHSPAHCTSLWLFALCGFMRHWYAILPKNSITFIECIVSLSHQQREVVEIFFQHHHQNQLCCSLTSSRDIIASTCNVYSRDFKTGVKNPSEEWHFSGLSYILPPQTLSGNLWGEYETTMWRRQHSLLYLSPSIPTSSQHWDLAALSDSVTQEELSCLSLQSGTKAGVKHNCCLALTERLPNHLCSCEYSQSHSHFELHTQLQPHQPWVAMQTHQEISLCPMSIPAPISADYNLWKVEQP